MIADIQVDLTNYTKAELIAKLVITYISWKSHIVYDRLHFIIPKQYHQLFLSWIDTFGNSVECYYHENGIFIVVFNN